MVHKGKKAYLKNQDAMKSSDSAAAPKKAKIIVRNLPFKNLSEKSVEDLFAEYGDIEEVKLLKKDNGMFLGCGFVQFKKVTSAAKAIRHANEKEILGRKIVVDWALPKKTFLEKIQKLEDFSKNDIKKEVLSDDENGTFDFVIDKKPEKLNSSNNHNRLEESGKESEEEEEEEEEEKEKEKEKDGDGDGGSDSYTEDSADDDDNNNDSDDDSEEENIVGKNKKRKEFINALNEIKKKQISQSNDIEEGKTVFVRNIPFSATNNDLKSCMESYGDIKYALICIDKLTEHSKGTGFVKFKEKESALKCIKNSGNIYLHDNALTVTMALSKENLESKKSSKKVVKDSRNLYLIREGVIVAGSKAAAGVSAGDMAKRLQLEQWKNQILKNLNMFVSKTRLVIHNLPPSYDDTKLRNLFAKHSSPKAIIKEAKVMYDKKNVNAAGKNISKEVGFVSFTSHEDALLALRNINNNPTIFTPKKRPIVAFSIENKAVINSKLKRIEKSRVKLGVSDVSDSLSKLNRRQRRFLKRREKFIERRKEAKKCKENEPAEGEENNKRKRWSSIEDQPNKKRKVRGPIQALEESSQNSFTGIMSKSGNKIKLRSKFRLKNQANIHNEALKKERRKKREKAKTKLERIKLPKEKKGRPKLIDDARLSKLLKKHRESVQESSVTKKWYDK